MQVEEIANRFDRLLEEERAAIRALDGPALERTAREKESLAEALRASSREELATRSDSLAKISASLRRNAVLLAHARDSLRDVIVAARGAAVETGHPLGRTVAPGVRLSRTV